MCTYMFHNFQIILWIFSRYKYETSVSHKAAVNSTETILPCLSNHSMTDVDDTLDAETKLGI